MLHTLALTIENFDDNDILGGGAYALYGVANVLPSARREQHAGKRKRELKAIPAN
jgi:hypothetical protein